MIRNIRLIKDFKDYLENENRSTFYSSSYGNSSAYDRCNTFFYEWSNINSTPLIFNSVKEFISFLKNSNITYTPVDETNLKYRYTNYCICKRGKAELILEPSKDALKNSFEKGT